MSEYFKVTLTAFEKATITQDDWDYCATHYYTSSKSSDDAYRAIRIMRAIHMGVHTDRVSELFKVSTRSIRGIVLRGIRKMNERRYELPENKLDRLLDDG